MIVTLTPNPSVDRTIVVPELRRGEVHRATDHHVDAGGKGVNVALALLSHGRKARAVLPSGGPEGGHLCALLAVANLDVVAVPIDGSIRSNVSLVEPDGTVTKFNEPGPALTATDLDELLRATVDAAEAADWLVGCGSLPPGTPDDLYARLVTTGRQAGALVAVDTSGAALAAALPAHPDLVKPNREELVEITGRSVETIGDAVDAAQTLHHLGARAVLATLGRHGALLVTQHEALYAAAPVTVPRSSVGAGDAALAGFLAGHADGAEDGLRTAVAWGTAAVRTAGSRMAPVTAQDLEQVDITREIPRAHRL